MSEIHGVQQHPVFARPQHHDVLAIVHRNPRDPHVAGLLQAVEQQRVGLLPGFVRRHVVGGLQVNRVHLVRLHELQDLHHLGRLRRHFLDFLVLDHNVAIFFVLESLDDLAARNRLIF